jgi:hypothetical protein
MALVAGRWSLCGGLSVSPRQAMMREVAQWPNDVTEDGHPTAALLVATSPTDHPHIAIFLCSSSVEKRPHIERAHCGLSYQCGGKAPNLSHAALFLEEDRAKNMRIDPGCFGLWKEM